MGRSKSERGISDVASPVAKQGWIVTPQTPNVAHVVVLLTCGGCSLLVSVQFAAHQNLQLFFSKAAVHPGDPLPVLTHGISPWWLLNFTFLFAEGQEVSVDSIFKFVKASLD